MYNVKVSLLHTYTNAQVLSTVHEKVGVLKEVVRVSDYRETVLVCQKSVKFQHICPSLPVLPFCLCLWLSLIQK